MLKTNGLVGPEDFTRLFLVQTFEDCAAVISLEEISLLDPLVQKAMTRTLLREVC